MIEKLNEILLVLNEIKPQTQLEPIDCEYAQRLLNLSTKYRNEINTILDKLFYSLLFQSDSR
jgi:hypothetical protein